MLFLGFNAYFVCCCLKLEMRKFKLQLPVNATTRTPPHKTSCNMLVFYTTAKAQAQLDKLHKLCNFCETLGVWCFLLSSQDCQEFRG
jgi:hypothetical protein